MNMNRKPVLWIVIPCYNEEAVLPKTAPLFLFTLREMMGRGKIGPDSRILYVDDGSKDTTWDLISSYAENESHVLGIRLSRNRGHQNAVFAGLMEAKDKCDMTISIDCDGQDDAGAMSEMVDAYLAGNEIVYGVRKSRDEDTLFKRGTARAYYRFLKKMQVEVVYDHADYRLIGSRALAHLSEFSDMELFLRGMVPQLGFKSTSVYYERTERKAGESHYPLSKMVALAKRGLFGFSARPLEIIEKTGFVIGLIGFLVFLVGLPLLIACALQGISLLGAGITTILGSIFFIGGLLLLAAGVAGEYAARAEFEVRRRPRYIIEERTGDRVPENGRSAERPAEEPDGGNAPDEPEDEDLPDDPDGESADAGDRD